MATMVNYWFDVKDAGAMGDGTTDDTTAIQTAASNAAAHGGTVYFPPGLYLISESILLGSETVVQGNPSGTSADDSTGRAIVIAGEPLGGGGINGGGVNGNIMFANSGFDGTSQQYNISIRDIGFNGSASENQRSDGNAALFFQGVKNLRIERCTVFNCASDAIAVLNLPSAEDPSQGNVWIRDNVIDILPTRNESGLQSGNYAIRGEGLNGVFIDGNVIGFNAPANWTPQTWSNDAITMSQCSWTSITNNQIQLAADGINVNDATNAVICGNQVLNCVGDGISTYSMDVSGQIYCCINGNVILGAVPDSDPPSLMGFAIRLTSDVISPQCQYASICGNVCFGPFTNGAIDGNASNATVSNNQIDCQGQITGGLPGVGIVIKSADCTITNNTIRNQKGTTTSTAAIHVDASLSGLVIQGNNVDDTNDTPIQFGGSAFPTFSLISENFGIVEYGTISQPSMVTGSNFVNPFPFDCTVYFRAAMASVLGVSINSISTGYTSGLNGAAVCAFRVKCGGTINVMLSAGSSTPHWVWIPD